MSAIAVEGARARRLTEWVFRVRELGILVVLLALIGVTGILEPRFLDSQNIRDILLNVAIVALLAVGQTIVVVTRNIDLSIERNATMTRMGSLTRLGLIRGGAEAGLAREWATRLQLKFHRLGDPVGFLSGGNQQKVVLAKWLATEPKLLIVDEPTRGIDVGTKAEVHRLMSELAGEGVAVLMISSELPEVLGMADRVLVMHEGRLVRELSRSEANEETVVRAATGQLERAA